VVYQQAREFYSVAETFHMQQYAVLWGGFAELFRRNVLLPFSGSKVKSSKKKESSTKLHGVTSQKIVLFIVIAVRISNPTMHYC
jgi:hypothetical protein